ncbi:MAG TPA: ATP-binding protein [Methylophilaceae bacterium]|nr:ATP-binding protein [Methylophilaceae bacterium]
MTLALPFIKKITLPELAKTRHWSLGLMLLSLHGALMGDFTDPLEIGLLITHYGLFLMWQPIWRNQQKLSLPAFSLLISIGALLVFFINWWVVAFWLCGLFGLLGGRVFSSQDKSSRIGYLLAGSYLLAMLLLWVVPRLLNTSELIAAEFMVQYLMPLMPLAILLTPAEVGERGNQPVLDLFYTLLLLFLAIILVLGSFAIEASSQASYIEVILRVLFGLAITLVGMSWLWNPRAGFAGIGQLLSRYLSSVGLPFEEWIQNIAVIAEREPTPKAYTEAAVRELAQLPWVSGVIWDTEDSQGEIGARSKHEAPLSFNDFQLTIYARSPMTPALLLHVKLLTRILGEFYEAKRREETMRQNVYMQAVYETGARLTHDIKNLVQSMGALCAAATQTSDTDNERLLALLRRQLPILNQRMASTLDKLEAPNSEKKNFIKLGNWWNNLKIRYSHSDVSFSAPVLPEFQVDTEVLDSVMDNLLQNALEKGKNEASFKVRASVVTGEKTGIEVMDTGKAMPEAVADVLFRKHVPSENGLGIGLYHAGRQAAKAGYALELAENREGSVRFFLNLKP